MISHIPNTTPTERALQAQSYCYSATMVRTAQPKREGESEEEYEKRLRPNQHMKDQRNAKKVEEAARKEEEKELAKTAKRTEAVRLSPWDMVPHLVLAIFT